MNGNTDSSILEPKLILSSVRPPADGKEDQKSLRACDSSTKHCYPEYKKMSRSECEGAAAPVSQNCCSKSEDYPNSESSLQSAVNCSPPAEQSTPPYCKWAQNLRYLLDDVEGVELFTQYLRDEGHDKRILHFWFACEGFKKGDQKRKEQLVKIINKKYVRSLDEINPETKDEINNKIASKIIDSSIFDVAQKEVEIVMTKTIYPNFLRSDIYVQYVRKIECNVVCHSPDESCASGHDSGRSVSRDGIDMLPTVDEDSELKITTYNKTALTKETFYQRSRFSDIIARPKPESEAGHYLRPQVRNYNSCYAKSSAFLPTSAQDSELQSLSSDAQTDDTLSLTDSMECLPSKNCKSFQKKCRSGDHTSYMNRDGLTERRIIPRTNTLPAEFYKNLDPKEFMSKLLPRLEKLLTSRKEEEKKSEKINESLQKIQVPYKSNAVFSSKLDNEPHPQLILDQHVSRVWEDSAHHTPVRTPGHLSPPVAQPGQEILDQQHISMYNSGNSLFTGGNSGTTAYVPKSQRSVHYVGSYQATRHRKDYDTYSCDSGTVWDVMPPVNSLEQESFHTSSSGRKGGNHYHNQNDQYTGSPADISTSTNRRSKELSRRSSNKKLIPPDDSGISMGGDSVTISSSSLAKLYMDSKSHSYYVPDCEKEWSVHYRKSHSSTSPVFGRSSKKPVAYNSTRPGTLDCGSNSWQMQKNMQFQQGHSQCGPQLNQHVPQDLSKPLPPPPDTTLQLVEARRRLEDEKLSKQIKNRSASGAKEKMYHDLVKTKGFYRPSEGDDSTLHRKSTRKPGTGFMQSSMPTTTASETTTIGYCFGSKSSVPYLTKLPGKNITLRQFKSLIAKKGNFKYFFKTASNEFGTEVVLQEISDDYEVLPLWEGKIFSVIEQME